jgi:hypothetical protein
MKKVKSETEQFCHDILNLQTNRKRPLANLVMSLSAQNTAQSVVALSESELFHYHYSNLPKILSDMSKDKPNFDHLGQQIRFLLSHYIPPIRAEIEVKFYGMTTDVTKILKPHSPTLEGRGYVPIANNVIATNKSISVGYRVSMTHLNACKVGEAPWSPPLSIKRMDVQDDALQVGIEQIKSLLADKTFPFGSDLVLHKADNAYGCAAFLSPLYEIENLVNLVRLRPSTKVWSSAINEDIKQPKGTPRIYGKKWYLSEQTGHKTYHRKGETYTVWQPSIMDLHANEVHQISVTLKNNRQVIVFLHRWNDIKIRSKNGHNMKDKPLDLVRVTVQDAQTKERVFNRPLFILVSGQRKGLIPTPLVQTQYRERSDVEGFYRFIKQRMLFDKLQTPNLKHLDNWLIVLMLSVWLLFTAKSSTHLDVKPWEKYLPINKINELNESVKPCLTLAQTRQSAKALFLTFDKTPFLPQKSKNGKGRQLGETQTLRQHFKIVKKNKKVRKVTEKNIRKLKNQQNE